MLPQRCGIAAANLSGAKLQSKLECIARSKGKDVREIVNQWLRKDVEFLEDLREPI